MNIISYATTPVAGVPAILARCITAATPHVARCVWARNDYGNGVVFDGDVEWTRSWADAEELISAADLIILHNGKVDPSHSRLLDRKPVITMAHNYRWNVDTTFFDMKFPGVVVGQYQASLSEFAGWAVVPNPVPFGSPLINQSPNLRSLRLRTRRRVATKATRRIISFTGTVKDISRRWKHSTDCRSDTRSV